MKITTAGTVGKIRKLTKNGKSRTVSRSLSLKQGKLSKRIIRFLSKLFKDFAILKIFSFKY